MGRWHGWREGEWIFLFFVRQVHYCFTRKQWVEQSNCLLDDNYKFRSHWSRNTPFLSVLSESFILNVDARSWKDVVGIVSQMPTDGYLSWAYCQLPCFAWGFLSIGHWEITFSFYFDLEGVGASFWPVCSWDKNSQNNLVTALRVVCKETIIRFITGHLDYCRCLIGMPYCPTVFLCTPFSYLGTGNMQTKSSSFYCITENGRVHQRYCNLCAKPTPKTAWKRTRSCDWQVAVAALCGGCGLAGQWQGLRFWHLLLTGGVIPCLLRNDRLLLCSEVLSRKYVAKDNQKCIWSRGLKLCALADNCSSWKSLRATVSSFFNWEQADVGKTTKFCRTSISFFKIFSQRFLLDCLQFIFWCWIWNQGQHFGHWGCHVPE